MSALDDNIWTTFKTRMYSERRYLRYNIAAHLWTSFASFLLIAMAIFSDKMKVAIPLFDQVNLALSVLVFALSLVLYGFRFSETAAQHRECYLKLQSLYNRRASVQNLSDEYDEILSIYPNQSENDYDDLVIDRAFFRNNPITAPGGTAKVLPTKLMYLRFFSRRILFFSTVYAIPLIAMAWLIQTIRG